MTALSPELTSQFQKLIQKHRLAPIEEFLLDNAEECYAVIATEPDDYSQVGNSRFGGDPDLPPKFRWPKDDNKFLNFFAQINFAELPALHSNQVLPGDGVLHLFAFRTAPLIQQR